MEAERTAVGGWIPSLHHCSSLVFPPYLGRKKIGTKEHQRNSATIKPKAELSRVFCALGSAVQGHSDLARTEASCWREPRRPPGKPGREALATGGRASQLRPKA